MCRLGGFKCNIEEDGQRPGVLFSSGRTIDAYDVLLRTALTGRGYMQVVEGLRAVARSEAQKGESRQEEGGGAGSSRGGRGRG